MAGNSNKRNTIFCTPAFGLFGSVIDLGIDLGPVRDRIHSCKLRYHKELWDIICDRGIQGSDWNKRSDGGEAAEEQPGAAEEGGGAGGEAEGNQSNTAGNAYGSLASNSICEVGGGFRSGGGGVRGGAGGFQSRPGLHGAMTLPLSSSPSSAAEFSQRPNSQAHQTRQQQLQQCDWRVRQNGILQNVTSPLHPQQKMHFERQALTQTQQLPNPEAHLQQQPNFDQKHELKKQQQQPGVTQQLHPVNARLAYMGRPKAHLSSCKFTTTTSSSSNNSSPSTAASQQHKSPPTGAPVLLDSPDNANFVPILCGDWMRAGAVASKKKSKGRQKHSKKELRSKP